MHQGQAQKGVSIRSELLSSLKVYLNNKNRLQPIIGLGSITECVKLDTHKREAFYLCEVCMCRLSKADMRNHIMGSLHRYKYIKAYYPCLVSEWKENSDLSKLAWPLMEIAKTIEGKEGVGDIQLLEVEDAVYQKIATHSESEAVAMIHFLREWQCEPESHLENTSIHLEHNSIQSQRIVLLAQHQQRWSEADKISHKTSPQTNMCRPLMQSSEAPLKFEGWLKNISESQMSPEVSVLSENNNSFLYDYTGSKPLIGLFRVVECRSEDGHTHIFLCHCCRIKSNKKDILSHLTSCSHLINYLMEKHPEQVDVMTADINDNCQLIQSLARQVEQEEGRGELKVINVPESLCIPLTGKSYHWWPSVNKTSVEDMPERCTVVLSKTAKRKESKRKMKQVAHTVFKVSLPLTRGSVLLERMSFSEDSLPMLLDSDPITSQTEVSKLDCDTGSFPLHNTGQTSVYTNSQLQQALDEELENEGQLTQNEELSPALFHTQDWSSYNSSVRHEERYAVQWYSSAPQNNVGTRVEMPREERQKEMTPNVTQHDYQQEPQNHYMTADTSLLTGSVGHHSLSEELAPCLDVARINVYPQFHFLAHRGNIALEPKYLFLATEQKQLQAYTEFNISSLQTFPQTYMMQPAGYQDTQTGCSVMSHPNYNVEP